MILSPDLAEVIAINDRPRLLHREIARLAMPFENMGMYQGEFQLSRMADLIIGEVSNPDEVVTLITSRAKEREAHEAEVQLVIADSAGLEAIRADICLQEIEDSQLGFIDISDPDKSSTKIGLDGQFGDGWIGRSKNDSIALLAMASIMGNGWIEIEDKAPGGAWIRANWSGGERYSHAEKVMLAESYHAPLASVTPFVPRQRKRLS